MIKKIMVSILVFFLLANCISCVSSETATKTPDELPSDPIITLIEGSAAPAPVLTEIDATPLSTIMQDIETPAISEPSETTPSASIANIDEKNYFFDRAKNGVSYHGLIVFMELQEIDVDLNIIKLDALEGLCKLNLDEIAGVPEERLNLGCFWVDGKTIYRINYGVDINNLINENDVINNSVMVCNDEPVADELSNEEKGYHRSIVADGNKRECHIYNNQVETGFYETFVWELGKGLVEYQSGFGAERDLIRITMSE